MQSSMRNRKTSILNKVSNVTGRDEERGDVCKDKVRNEIGGSAKKFSRRRMALTTLILFIYFLVRRMRSTNCPRFIFLRQKVRTEPKEGVPQCLTFVKQEKGKSLADKMKEIFTPLPKLHIFQGNKKLKQRIPGAECAPYNVELHIDDIDSQRRFIKAHGSKCHSDGDGQAILARFDLLGAEYETSYQTELWKYCALAVHGGIYVDHNSVALRSFISIFPLSSNGGFFGGPNYAFLSSVHPGTIHGSIIGFNSPMDRVALSMVTFLVESTLEDLQSSPLIISKTLYYFISYDLDNDPNGLPLVEGYNSNSDKSSEWMMWNLGCSPAGKNVLLTDLKCPVGKSFCCHLTDPCNEHQVHAVTDCIVLPELKSLSFTRTPFRLTHLDDERRLRQDLPYMVTLREEIYDRPPGHSPRNFYQMIEPDNCLPNGDCIACISNPFEGGTCDKCEEFCGCYCQAVCKINPEKKFVSKKVIISLPEKVKDPKRLVPRIIHQTWFEPITREKYPGTSHLVQTFKDTGYDYRFYDDDNMRDFLKMHFPPEVLDAYDIVKPGALKADLFRYCTLLIYGGVYADADIQLLANLDELPDDIGFMTPSDEPGRDVGRGNCIWNGLIFTSPGHPFIAQALELSVNNIRNRYTNEDFDAQNCPNPQLSTIRNFYRLHIAGPCMLGSALNSFFGRHYQNQIDIGEMKIPPEFAHVVPGRVIILKQHRANGVHQFLLEDKNMTIAATDLPGYGEWKDMGLKHYSQFGPLNLYVDNNPANEEIRFVFE